MQKTCFERNELSHGHARRPKEKLTPRNETGMSGLAHKVVENHFLQRFRGRGVHRVAGDKTSTLNAKRMQFMEKFMMLVPKVDVVEHSVKDRMHQIERESQSIHDHAFLAVIKPARVYEPLLASSASAPVLARSSSRPRIR
jgi:hypothetical protein